MDCRRNTDLVIRFIACLLSVAAFVGLVYLVLLSPRISIQQLHIRKDSENALNPNTSIVVDLKFKRSITPIHYDDIKITLYCAYNQSFSVVGYTVIPGFKMAWKITAHREAVVEARGAAWDNALRMISQGSTVGLRAELTTKYKVVGKGSLCSFCKKAVAVAAELRLDSSGELSKKPIRLH